MKKIINGKKYDTETAELEGQDYASCAVNDFNYWWEGLYLKKTGEFFLHGEGNAASRYSRSCGSNEQCGGEAIIPLSIEQAKEWVMKHSSADKYERLFGQVEE